MTSLARVLYTDFGNCMDDFLFDRPRLEGRWIECILLNLRYIKYTISQT